VRNKLVWGEVISENKKLYRLIIKYDLNLIQLFYSSLIRKTANYIYKDFIEKINKKLILSIFSLVNLFSFNILNV
jgi:hypothetical protein